MKSAYRAALAWRDCRLLVITAHLGSAVALPAVFPAPLDGVMASESRRRRLGGSYGLVDDHHTECLPLASTARSTPGAPRTGAQWVYAASCAQPLDGVTQTTWKHQRAVDIATAEEVGAVVPANADVGRYKPWRIPVVTTVASALRWVVCGDRDAVANLLSTVCQLGADRGSGEGVVMRWEVVDVGEPTWGPIVWEAYGVTARIARPWPTRAAESLGLTGPESILHTIRPPYWRAPQHEVEGGGFGRRMPSVIAPWTTRPS